MSDASRARRAPLPSRFLPSPARRRLLARAAAGAAVAANVPLSGCARWGPGPDRPGENFIVHGPTDWETRPAAFGDAPVTPHGTLYVCNHLPFPGRHVVADPARWRLDVLGTREPGRFSLARLHALGTDSVAMVLQCAGNGRQFFEHGPHGPGWRIGAVGCVLWTGVSLRRVVAASGGLDGHPRYATATGGEAVNPLLDELFSLRVERSIPLDKALEDCLLAWKMNGAPIPRVHGGPLRLIVPGYFGINQIKYLRRLAFTDEQSDADVMRREYRLRAVGENGPATPPTTWAMSAKSIIWPPATPTVGRGSTLRGVAFGGLEPIERVDITWNDGSDWESVPLSSPHLGRYAWRRFSVPLPRDPGYHRVASRAVDAAGARQPRWHTPNVGGYANASWHDHAVRLAIA